ncbi:MAG: SRPBCC domain-containing protein [Thermoplasmata archaeon]
MPEEPLDPILIQVTIPLPIPMIHAAFTDAEKLKGWLCDAATVEARVGGPYRLEWRAPTEFTSPGEVTQYVADVDIGFSWFGPPPFEDLMNRPTPRTSVYVRLQESPEGIDVTMEHSGWGGSAEWEKARSWHFHFWDDRLSRLKEFLIREAYG